jgi:sugar phosphate isomerase/epimerase
LLSAVAVHIAIRVSYPETGDHNWHDALALYAEGGAVEVAFYRPEPFLARVEEAAVAAPFATLPLRVTTVHMAHAWITEFATFRAVLEKTFDIAQALDCSRVVVHPSNARLEDVEGWIMAEVNPLLEAADITLCWETFAGQRRFLSGIEEISAFCQGKRYHRACYDTSHLHKPRAELLADVARYAPAIGCYHLSNRSEHRRQQHLPLCHPEGDIDFQELIIAIIRSGFQGPLILEYLPEFHHRLGDDARWIKNQLVG